MIVYPKDWQQVGVEITPADVEYRIRNVLAHIDCKSLAFSGGLDSSLLLYYMCEMYESINTIQVFTIGKSEDHKDVVFAKKVVEYFANKFNISIVHKFKYPRDEEIEGHIDRYSGDRAVELFYQFVSKYTDEIIAGDGVDEFMCGYYVHMKYPFAKTYHDYMRRLQEEQFGPLNENSGRVKVYLPYADKGMISLMSQIPLKDKVDGENRKKFLVNMAKGRIPDDVISRRKYGFCDALMENKGESHVSH